MNLHIVVTKIGLKISLYTAIILACHLAVQQQAEHMKPIKATEILPM